MCPFPASHGFIPSQPRVPSQPATGPLPVSHGSLPSQPRAPFQPATSPFPATTTPWHAVCFFPSIVSLSCQPGFPPLSVMCSVLVSHVSLPTLSVSMTLRRWPCSFPAKYDESLLISRVVQLSFLPFPKSQFLPQSQAIKGSAQCPFSALTLDFVVNNPRFTIRTVRVGTQKTHRETAKSQTYMSGDRMVLHTAGVFGRREQQIRQITATLRCFLCIYALVIFIKCPL